MCLGNEQPTRDEAKKVFIMTFKATSNERNVLNFNILLTHMIWTVMASQCLCAQTNLSHWMMMSSWSTLSLHHFMMLIFIRML